MPWLHRQKASTRNIAPSRNIASSRAIRPTIGPPATALGIQVNTSYIASPGAGRNAAASLGGQNYSLNVKWSQVHSTVGGPYNWSQGDLIATYLNSVGVQKFMLDLSSINHPDFCWYANVSGVATDPVTAGVTTQPINLTTDPTVPDTFAEFVHNAILHYSGKITHIRFDAEVEAAFGFWQIGVDSNLVPQYADRATAWAAVQNVLKTVAHNTDPSIIVTTSGTASEALLRMYCSTLSDTSALAYYNGHNLYTGPPPDGVGPGWSWPFTLANYQALMANSTTAECLSFLTQYKSLHNYDAWQIHYYGTWYSFAEIYAWAHGYLPGIPMLGEYGVTWDRVHGTAPAWDADYYSKWVMKDLCQAVGNNVPYESWWTAFDDRALTTGLQGMIDHVAFGPIGTAPTAFRQCLDRLDYILQGNTLTLPAGAHGYRYLQPGGTYIYALWADDNQTVTGVNLGIGSSYTHALYYNGTSALVDATNLTITDSPFWLSYSLLP